MRKISGDRLAALVRFAAERRISRSPRADDLERYLSPFDLNLIELFVPRLLERAPRVYHVYVRMNAKISVVKIIFLALTQQPTK
jgi:hypothetical protein